MLQGGGQHPRHLLLLHRVPAQGTARLHDLRSGHLLDVYDFAEFGENTKIDNLRALCFNCVYTLSTENKGWYRHRRNPIRLSLEDIPPDISDKMTEIPSDEPEVDYMPFEEFQKLL